jgi:hypothetical protein
MFAALATRKDYIWIAWVLVLTEFFCGQFLFSFQHRALINSRLVAYSRHTWGLHVLAQNTPL